MGICMAHPGIFGMERFGLAYGLKPRAEEKAYCKCEPVAEYRLCTGCINDAIPDSAIRLAYINPGQEFASDWMGRQYRLGTSKLAISGCMGMYGQGGFVAACEGGYAAIPDYKGTELKRPCNEAAKRPLSTSSPAYQMRDGKSKGEHHDKNSPTANRKCKTY